MMVGKASCDGFESWCYFPITTCFWCL